MALDFPTSPTLGQSYSPTSGPTYVWDGTVWKVAAPGSSFNRSTFTATAGQTSFTVSYIVGTIDVFRNGVKLVSGTDYTATSGTAVVLTDACTVGDTVETFAYSQIEFANAVKKTGDTMTGDLTVQSNAFFATNSGYVGIGTSSPISTQGRSLHLYNSSSAGTVADNSTFKVESVNRNSVIILQGNATSTQQVQFTDASALNYASIRGETATNALTFFTGSAGSSAERMRIDSSGNVGIGNTSSTYSLTVEKNQNADTTIGIRNTTAGTSSRARFIAISDAGSGTFGFTSSSYTGITGAADALLINADNASGGMVFALDGVGKMVLDSNGRIGVGPTPTNVATYNNSGKNFSVAGESSTYPSTITQVGDGSTTYGNGYYAKEVFRITGLGSATEISRITGTGSNGFGLYIKVIACGHSASTGSAVNIKEYFYTGGTAAATQISSVTSGTVPPITIDTSTNNVVIVKLASANPAAGSFNGTVIIEWAVSPSFDSAPGGLWTIS